MTLYALAIRVKKPRRLNLLGFSYYLTLLETHTWGTHIGLHQFVSRDGILAIGVARIFTRHQGYSKLHQAGVFFVTRAKRGMNAQRVYSVKTDRTTGVVCDQSIRLSGYYVSRDYPEHLRRIRYKDPESGKTLVFLTNNTSFLPLTITALYKSRWQVELFFKWIKQHLRIKRFLGTRVNAVKTQI